MISVISVYDDVRFRVNKENGYLAAKEFNDASWLAQLSMIDWLTGGASGQDVPSLFVTQKNRDWAAVFIVNQVFQNITDGVVTKPDDYYLFEDLYKSNGISVVVENGEEITKDIADASVDILASNKFNERASTTIEELKPSPSSLIAKMYGNKIEIRPKDLGTVVLVYIRYPKRSNIKMTEDSVYHNEVPDVDLSENFEWGEYARKLLVWFIVDEIANHTREQALKQFNAATEGGKK